MNNASFHVLIKEIAGTHQLSESIVVDTVYNVFKRNLTLHYGYPVEIWFAPELSLRGYPIIEGEIREIEIPVKSAKKLLTAALQELEQTLQLHKANSDILTYDIYRKTISLGKITHIHNDNSITAELDGVSLQAFCPVGKQIPQERGILRVGDERWFYINRLEIQKINDSIRTSIILSRVSISLPRLLLLKYIDNAWKLECVKRQCGVISKIRSRYPIPKKYILATSVALCGERIQVKYDG